MGIESGKNSFFILLFPKKNIISTQKQMKKGVGGDMQQSKNNNDLVITISSDGTVQASFPHVEEKQVPDHVRLGAALMYAVKNVELRNIIEDAFYSACLR